MADAGASSGCEGCDDDRILTYGDSTVVRSDLHVLRGPHYLNDRLIHFFFCHLSSNYSDDILLVPPSLSYLIANYPDSASLADVVAPLRLQDKALLLFPVNDNPDVAIAEGGSHWSLLVCHVPSRLFVHHDSSGGLNSPYAHTLYLLLRRFLGHADAPFPFRYQEGPTPRQINGYDCGLYVLAIARCVCDWYCKIKNNELPDNTPNWFHLLSEQLNPDKVHQLRAELLSLILNLMHQSHS